MTPGAGSRQRLGRLLTELGSNDPERRRVAALRLGELGDIRALAPLIAAAGRGGGERAKHAAILALARLGPPAVPALGRALEHDASRMRRASAAEALGLIGHAQGAGPLLAAMSDSSADVRMHATVALLRLRERRAVPLLIGALSDLSGGVRLQAATALGVLRSKRAIPALALALRDEKWYVRQQAATTLGLLGDVRALPALQEAAEDARPAVARAAREAGGRLT